MYITINNIKFEKRIDLSYSIQNFDSTAGRGEGPGGTSLHGASKEIAVFRMLSDNVKHEILKLHAIMDPISNTKKMIPSKTYAGRELLPMLEGMVELNQFVVDDQVIQKNKLKGITEMILNLNELDNSDNLKDGRPSNELLTYHVTDDKDFMHFEPDIYKTIDCQDQSTTSVRQETSISHKVQENVFSQKTIMVAYIKTVSTTYRGST